MFAVRSVTQRPAAPRAIVHCANTHDYNNIYAVSIFFLPSAAELFSDCLRAMFGLELRLYHVHSIICILYIYWYIMYSKGNAGIIRTPLLCCIPMDCSTYIFHRRGISVDIKTTIYILRSCCTEIVYYCGSRSVPSLTRTHLLLLIIYYFAILFRIFITVFMYGDDNSYNCYRVVKIRCDIQVMGCATRISATVWTT